MHHHFDCIVVGAGIVGSSTAYNLAKDGKKTLLLEQFPLPHSRGSSHGGSRITRMAYSKARYMQMMPLSHRLWKQLEIESGATLYRKTGLLWMGAKSAGEISRISKDFEQLGLAYESLTAEQVCQRYPQLKFDCSWVGFFEPEGGILYASKCVAAFQSCFQKSGGVIHDSEPVKSLKPGKSEVEIQTSKATYTANKLVLCAGPWTNKLLQLIGPTLPFQPELAPAMYWKAGDQYSADADFPCFMIDDDPIYHRKFVYGLPNDEYQGLLKCGTFGVATEPDDRDDVKTEEPLKHTIDVTRSFLSKHFTGVQTDQPAILERCMTTIAPDMDYVMDTHPHFQNIIVGAGFSGHGFKLAPVSGKILAGLAAGKPKLFDMEPYRFGRFSENAKL